MNEMDNVVQKNASASEESASSAEELSSQANELNDIVQELKQLAGGKKEKRTDGYSSSYESNGINYLKEFQNGTSNNGNNSHSYPKNGLSRNDSSGKNLIPFDDDFSGF
jgi:hypothetical protein